MGERVPTRSHVGLLRNRLLRGVTGIMFGVRAPGVHIVELPTELLAHLAALDAALDDGIHLDEMLYRLIKDAVDAVPALLAISVTVAINDHPVTVGSPTVDDTVDQAQASISITLPSVGTGCDDAQLIAHAATSGAFVDLAIDAIHTLGISPELISVDQHLAVDSANGTYSSTLAELSAVNQAVGILIERGRTPSDAIAEIRSSADVSDRTVYAEAANLIESVRLHQWFGPEPV